MLWTIIKQIFWIYNNNIDRCVEYIWNEGYFNTYPSPSITNHSMYNSIPKRKYMMDSFDISIYHMNYIEIKKELGIFAVQMGQRQKNL